MSLSRWALLLALCVCMAVPSARAAGSAEPTEAPAGEADSTDLILPVGTVFQPPGDAEVDFKGDPPVPRQPVEKDTRVVAVIFSVNQMEAMRKAFPDVENVDLMPVAGRPMIEHVIAGVKTSRYIDRVIVVADAAVRDALAFDDDPALTFIEDRGDAAENVKNGIHAIARGDLVLLLPSDLPLVSAASLDPLIEHAREYDDIDVFFPLIQRERFDDSVLDTQRFVRFKEGRFTGAHVELVRPALFVDNPADVEGEQDRMYDVYHMRRDTIGIVRFLGLKLTVKYIIRDLSPTDIATRLYAKYHVRAQAFVAGDPRLAVDVNSPDAVVRCESAIATVAGGELVTAERAESL